VVLVGGLYRVESPATTKGAPLCEDLARLRFDDFLNECAGQAMVIVMPGDDDATTYLWPQTPLPSFLFPTIKKLYGPRIGRMPLKPDETSAAHLQVVLVSNPVAFDFMGQSFMGTSGKNVHSVLQTTKGLAPLEVMEGMLHWQHMCPTAPTYLPSVPVQRKGGRAVDPFVLEYTPRFFFCGNQEESGAKLVSFPNGASCTLMSVPKFSQTRKALLLDVYSGEVSSLDWSSDS